MTTDHKPWTVERCDDAEHYLEGRHTLDAEYADSAIAEIRRRIGVEAELLEALRWAMDHVDATYYDNAIEAWRCPACRHGSNSVQHKPDCPYAKAMALLEGGAE